MNPTNIYSRTPLGGRAFEKNLPSPSTPLLQIWTDHPLILATGEAGIGIGDGPFNARSSAGTRTRILGIATF
jgi:hypothetical protein